MEKVVLNVSDQPCDKREPRRIIAYDWAGKIHHRFATSISLRELADLGGQLGARGLFVRADELERPLYTARANLRGEAQQSQGVQKPRAPQTRLTRDALIRKLRALVQSWRDVAKTPSADAADRAIDEACTRHANELERILTQAPSVPNTVTPNGPNILRDGITATLLNGPDILRDGITATLRNLVFDWRKLASEPAHCKADRAHNQCLEECADQLEEKIDNVIAKLLELLKEHG